MKRTRRDLIWEEVIWRRPFDFQMVEDLMTHLAGLELSSPITWEVRASGGRIRYLIGSEAEDIKKLKDVFLAHGNMQIVRSKSTKRQDIIATRKLRLSCTSLSLKTDNALAVTRASLSAMVQAGTGEEIVLQIILGASFTPSAIPKHLPDPHASWLNILCGNIQPASAESRASYKEKFSYHRFACMIRIGAMTENIKKAEIYIWNLLCALRVLESAGVKISSVPDKAQLLNNAHAPWHFPLLLSVKELACLSLLPYGEGELPGVMGLHPKLLPPPKWLQETENNLDCNFGVCLDDDTNLGLSLRDSLEHTVILGPTGSGKSTVMLSLILSDINAGRGVLVIDPKADLVNDVLRRIPDSRKNDVVVIDPSDSNPVGFNPFQISRRQSPELVADAILAVFKDIFADSWGIRTEDILSGALLTLAQDESATLVLLPALLTDERFRHKITRKINDKIGLEPFWQRYDAMGNAERNQVIAPVLNKMRQFLLRPSLRNVLGQIKPEFSLEDLFTKNRIVLVSLNKGIIGAENARLLGSLIVGLTWTLALSRAKDTPERRHIVHIFIDELQDYLSLPTDLSDALAQARSLGVGLIMAHQYRSQLPLSIRAGIDANARNKIIFGLNAGDAKDLAAMAPELEPIDFMLLKRYSIYASLQRYGRSTGWVSGKTLPPIPVVRSAVEIKAESMKRYGRNHQQTEAEYLKVLGYLPDQNTSNREPEIIGRKKIDGSADRSGDEQN